MISDFGKYQILRLWQTISTSGKVENDKAHFKCDSEVTLADCNYAGFIGGCLLLFKVNMNLCSLPKTNSLFFNYVNQNHKMLFWQEINCKCVKRSKLWLSSAKTEVSWPFIKVVLPLPPFPAPSLYPNQSRSQTCWVFTTAPPARGTPSHSLIIGYLE